MRRFTYVSICAILALAVASAPPALGTTVYISTSSGGVKVSNLENVSSGDIVALDLNTGVASLYFDHQNFRKSNGRHGNSKNIDAIHIIDDSRFLLSTSQSAYLGQPQKRFSDADIVEYNKATDTADVLYQESSLFWYWSSWKKKWKSTTSEDIDGLCRLTDGSYVLSAKDTARVGGNHLEITADDLAKYDPATDTASYLLKGSDVFTDKFGNPYYCENIDGICCDEDTGLIYFSVSGSAYVRSDGDILPVNNGDIVEYDTNTGNSTIFLSFDDLINKWCGTENIDGLCIVGMESPIPPPSIIPEPLTMAALSLGLACVSGYVRRRTKMS